MCLFLALSILQHPCVFNLASSRSRPPDFLKCSCCFQSCLVKLPFHFFFSSLVTNHPWQFPPYSLFTTSLCSVQLTQNSNPRTHVPPLSSATWPFHFPPFHSHACFSFAPNDLHFSPIQHCKCCRLWLQLFKSSNGWTETAFFTNFPLTTTTSFAVVPAFPTFGLFYVCVLLLPYSCSLYWTGAELSRY